MGLEIASSRITRILLPDGKWHDVVPGSFSIDAYDFNLGDDSEEPEFENGSETRGVTWREVENGAERTFFAPFSSIKAVCYDD